MRIPKIERGHDVARIAFEHKADEPRSFVVEFPGGKVEVARTSEGDAWVHVSVNKPSDAGVLNGYEYAGRIVGWREDKVPGFIGQMFGRVPPEGVEPAARADLGVEQLSIRIEKVLPL